MSQIFEPGAAKYGNFISYYKFQSPRERTELIPFDLLLNKNAGTVLLLDVGCNTGELTEELHKAISLKRRCETLAVDIDKVLIERALERNLSPYVTYKCTDITCPKDFTSNIEKFLTDRSKKQFDVIFMFSVTMWIHLNTGDTGLLNVLANLTKLTDTLVIEAQPWKCYKSAARRLRRAKKDPFIYFDVIQMRETIEDDINSFLIEKCHFKKIHTTMKTCWNRQIVIYTKI